MTGPIASRPYEWAQVPWAEGRVLIRGTVDELPVLTWGSADRGCLATTRQLRELGLRPGGAEPVAVLAFGHRQPGRRDVEHARLYAIADAAPKRDATPAQRAAIDKALAARRTCLRCAEQQDYYLSTVSRMCGPCSEATGFWDHKIADTSHDPTQRHADPATTEPTTVEPDEAPPIPAQRMPEHQPAELSSREPGRMLERARHAVGQLSTVAATRPLEDTHSTRHVADAAAGGDRDMGTEWGRSA